MRSTREVGQHIFAPTIASKKIGRDSVLTSRPPQPVTAKIEEAT